MTPKDFEYTVAEILRRLDYKDVKIIGGSGDLGVDILAYKDSNKVAVQYKQIKEDNITRDTAVHRHDGY